MSSNVLPSLRIFIRTSIALTLIAAVRPAEAGRATAVILTRGDASRADHVKKAARAWLEARGAQVTDGGLVAKDAAKLADCLAANPLPCADVIARTGANRLWLFQLETQRRERATDLNIVLSVFGANGQSLATDERYCSRCRPETLTAQIEKVLDVVSRAALTRTSARTVIRVRTEPGGALIAIDGRRVGTAAPEFAYRVNPGEHEIKASLAGHKPTIRRVDLEDGEEKSLVLRLEANGEELPNSPPTTQSPRRSKWPYVVGGVGVATMSVGIGFLVFRDSDEENGAQKYRTRNRVLPGALLTASGAVVTGVAVYLFVRTTREDDAPVVPTASVSGRELTFGVQGRF